MEEELMDITEATDTDWEEFWEEPDLFDDYAHTEIDIDYTTQS